MIRSRFALVALGLLLVLRPSPAYAWLGWLEELSGPKLHGWQLDARLWCFGPDPSRDPTAIKVAVRATAAALRDRAFHDPSVIPYQSLFLKYATPVAIEEYLNAASGQASPEVTAVRSPANFTDAARKLGEQPSKSPAIDATQNDLRSIAAALHTLEGSPRRQKLGGGGAIGITVSLCNPQKEGARRVSIDLSSRFYSQAANDNPSPDTLAGGNAIHFTTLAPTLSYRPLYGSGGEYGDVFDVGGGGGIYWFGSDQAKPGAMESFHGAFLEARVEAHLPPRLVAQSKWWRLVPQYRLTRMYFPSGFKKGAFGSINGSKAIGPEGAWERSLFWDLGIFAR